MRIVEAHCHGYDDRNIDGIRQLGYEKVYLIDPRPAYLKEAMRKYPDLMLGFGWLPTDGKPKDDVKMVDKFHDVGCTGIKLCGAVCRYDDDSLLPVYERIAKYKMPIVFHTGWLWWGGFWSGEDYRMKKDARVDYYHPCTLDRLQFLFPDTKMVAYHIGNQWMDSAAYMIKNHRNLYGDTVMPRHRKEYLWDLLGGDSSALLVLSKLLFGTDAAYLEYQGCKEHVDYVKGLLDSLNLNQAVQDRVFYRNALEIAGIADDQKKTVRLSRRRPRPAIISDFADHDLRRLGEQARSKTQCSITCGEKAITLSFTCAEKKPRELVLTSAGVPASIWQDDCVEAFLSPDGKKYFHLMVNPLGQGAYDFDRGEIRGLPKCQSSIANGVWKVTIDLPFTLLRATPRPGDTWGLNLCRTKKSSPAETSVWNPVIFTFHDPQSFGKLVFE